VASWERRLGSEPSRRREQGGRLLSSTRGQTLGVERHTPGEKREEQNHGALDRRKSTHREWALLMCRTHRYASTDTKSPRELRLGVDPRHSPREIRLCVGDAAYRWTGMPNALKKRMPQPDPQHGVSVHVSKSVAAMFIGAAFTLVFLVWFLGHWLK